MINQHLKFWQQQNIGVLSWKRTVQFKYIVCRFQLWFPYIFIHFTIC